MLPPPPPSSPGWPAPPTPPSSPARPAPLTPRPSRQARPAPLTPRPSRQARPAPLTPRPSRQACPAPLTPRPSRQACPAPLTPPPSLQAPPAWLHESWLVLCNGEKPGIYNSKRTVKKKHGGVKGKPKVRKFHSYQRARQWLLKYSIPRASQVDPLLPDSLRWNGMKDLVTTGNRDPSPFQPAFGSSVTGDYELGSSSDCLSKSASFESTSSAFTIMPPPGLIEALQSSLAKARNEGFTTTSDGALVVYTDGSVKSPSSRYARAGSGVFWGLEGEARKWNMDQRVAGDSQTVFRSEMNAIILALEYCPFPDLPLEIRTDSRDCITTVFHFIPRRLELGFRNWTNKKAVDSDVIVHLLALLSHRKNDNGVRFKHVRAHRGELGNEAADRLASRGTNYEVVLFREWRTLADVDRARRQRARRLDQRASETECKEWLLSLRDESDKQDHYSRQ